METHLATFRRARPAWPSLRSADPQGARDFYGAVLGWESEERSEEPATLGGRPVASIGPILENGPAGWTLCIGVVDVDETIRAAVSGGATVLVDRSVGLPGVDAVLADPAGTAFGIHRLADGDDVALDVPGALLWGELITDDVAGSAEFYGSVFGWSVSEPEDPLNRRMWQLHGRTISLLLPRPAAMAKDVPAYWDLYFRVEDLGSTAATAVEAGGRQLVAPTPIGLGDISVFLDPAGAVFTLIKPAS